MGRVIKLNTIPNCRQLGGLITSDGHRIGKNKLLRSAGLFSADYEDLKTLKDDYGLSLVIDLRTAGEISEKPDRYYPGIENVNYPIFDDSVFGITHEVKTDESLGEKRPIDLVKLYKMMVTDTDCRKNFKKALEKIMSHDYAKGSVMWHCSEGKDRCGLISLFLSSILGVNKSIAIDDYLLTNETNNHKADYYYRKLKSEGESDALALAVKNVFLAKKEYINAAIFELEKEYGSINNFLYNGISISERLVSKFKNSVLE
jgi:protein-tyrosine phosphatase